MEELQNSPRSDQREAAHGTRQSGDGRREAGIASAVVAGVLLAVLALNGCMAAGRPSSSRVRQIDEHQLTALLQAQRGKPVVLNFWATWCEPCVAEFPDLVRLAREQSGRLQVIAVSIDVEEDRDAKVIPFLQQQDAPFVSYLKRAKDDEAFINHIDSTWSGAIPATFIYRADGSLAMRLIGQQNLEKFLGAVQQASALPGPSPQPHDGVQ